MVSVSGSIPGRLPGRLQMVSIPGAVGHGFNYLPSPYYFRCDSYRRGGSAARVVIGTGLGGVSQGSRNWSVLTEVIKEK